MPVYQFKCPECGHEEEQLLKNINDPNPTCPNHDVLMERQFPTGTTFRLKGGGWYKDGYSNAKKESSNIKG